MPEKTKRTPTYDIPPQGIRYTILYDGKIIDRTWPSVDEAHTHAYVNFDGYAPAEWNVVPATKDQIRRGV